MCSSSPPLTVYYISCQLFGIRMIKYDWNGCIQSLDWWTQVVSLFIQLFEQLVEAIASLM